MKKLFLAITIVGFALIGILSANDTSADKGQKLFKKNLRKTCGFSGVRFAKKHTQEEWEEIYSAKKFPQEVKKICPRLQLEKSRESWWPHIYKFSYKYASDSSQIPKC